MEKMIMQKKYLSFFLISLSSILLLFSACSLDDPTGPPDMTGGNNAGGDSSSQRVGRIILTSTQTPGTAIFTIQATVYNTAGAHMGGITVNFRTTDGDFESGGSSTSSVTDTWGNAFAILETFGTAIVTASAQGVSASISVSFSNKPPEAALLINPTTATHAPSISVLLDASNSVDSDGTIINYRFEAFTSTPGITFQGLGNTGSPVQSVTINGANTAGIVITFLVTVTDDGGLTSQASATFTTS